jgi:hypothetical protein
MHTEFKILKVKVPIIFLGTVVSRCLGWKLCRKEISVFIDLCLLKGHSKTNGHAI